jgi:NAD(P)-dependent dehydrogenase (short-subunit alcohol dehydrogenase family)
MSRFEGKVAVVTGGAMGIGAACVERLASEGAVVYLADVDDAAGAKTAAETGAAFVHCDVSRAADWESLAAHVVREHGRLDVLVSNAYALRFGAPHELPEDDWDVVQAVTLKATYLGLKVFAEALTAAGGSVVAVSSVHAHASYPGFAAYAAAKGGLAALVRQLAVEYAPAVRVNAVVPGPILTRQFSGLSPESIADEAGKTLAGRLGRPEEVAAVIAFLASDEAAYVTGAELAVDGGWQVKHR